MPDTSTNPALARGVLEDKSETKIVVSFPDTSYQMHLGVLREPTTDVGDRIRGTIRVRARRIDVVNTGGRYVEPVYGRPRRVQGRVLEVDGANNTITVHAGMPLSVTLSEGQRAGQFEVGDFVSFDAKPGATFTPA